MEGQSLGKRGGSADLPATPCVKKGRQSDQTAAGGMAEGLKDYKDVQNKLKDILDKSVKKLSEFLSTSNLPERRNMIEYLKNRLSGMKPDVVVDPIYIGVFGSTGAGKSTLLNAIMDKNFFLPVSGSKACTSCVVQVGTGLSRLYEAKIHLLTDEEWKEELKGLVELAEPDEDDDDYERNEAVSKISAIYGEEAERKSYEELRSTKPIVPIPSSRCITIKATKEEELSEKMNPYVQIQSIRSDVNEGTSEKDRNTQLWPLVKNVEVTIPKLKLVPEGVVFMDIPGTGDFSSRRDAMWKENINKCSVIWVVNSIERIQGQKTHELMLKEGMKAFQRGMCRDISLVVTKSDQMDVNEYKRERKKGDINKHDAILERNEMVKQEKGVMMKKNLEKKLPSDSEVLHKDDLVYTVSAREYWNGETLTKEETEIPKLREYIHKLYEAQKRNVLMDNVEEVWIIFSLIQSIWSKQDAQSFQHQSMKESILEHLIENLIGLNKDIEKCFVEVELPLHEGVAEAKRLCNESINKILNRDRGNRGFHRTLKAVCLNVGMYVSKVFGRIDINSSLAQPIYDSIDMSFGNIFRIQMGSRLKVCLDTFKDNMKKQLREAVEGYSADSEEELRFLQQETDFIIKEAEKVILQKKAEIYNSLTVSIQNDLLPCYGGAAKQRGSRSYQRMKNILTEGIGRALEGGMFEKAQESMKKHFEDLQVEIVSKMEKDFFTMLDLVFCPWDQLRQDLPDLQDEISSIRTAHEALQPARDA